MTIIKLLALDLDGTLFDSQKIVSQKNKEAISAATKKGVKVVITTGRPLKAIGNLLEELQLDGHDDYCVTFNGGLVQRSTGEILDKSSFGFDDLIYINKQLDKLSLPTDILSDGTVYSVPSHDGIHSRYHEANPLLKFVEINAITDIPKDIIYNKIVTVTDAIYLDQQLAKATEDTFKNYEHFKSRDIIFEIMPKGIHKAFGLKLLCQHLDIKPEEVMAMGDEANDMTMLKWAGLGIAMANATPAVKAIAQRVTRKTNDESGVAEAIHDYILSEEI